MTAHQVFLFEKSDLASRARLVLSRLPPLVSISPIRVQRHPGLRDGHGPVHAGSFLRERRIAVDCRRDEFARVFVHEVFHFAWLRLGNSRRRSFEALLSGELDARARGELGWSAEWRKRELQPADVAGRSRSWREYCCESFCDSAAWLYSGLKRHPEFTLRGPFRTRRRQWFDQLTAGRALSI